MSLNAVAQASAAWTVWMQSAGLCLQRQDGVWSGHVSKGPWRESKLEARSEEQRPCEIGLNPAFTISAPGECTLLEGRCAWSKVKW